MIPLFLYRILTVLCAPFIYGWIYVRCHKGKEDVTRLNERFGRPNRIRTSGRLIWMHGASVGECLSMLPLIKKIIDENPDIHVMVTSGTVTSAKLMTERLPNRAFHQYVPIDLPWAVQRFVRYWHPDAAFWFESEFWPNLLSAVASSGAPLVLLNGRISDRSFRRWQRALWFIRPILRLFTLSLGQTKEDTHRLKKLGAKQALYVGNLKYAAVPAVFDATELATLKEQIGSRPCWCAGSTHADEEARLADVHIRLKQQFKGLLWICSPRHPTRGDMLEKMFLSKGLQVARRSRHEPLTPQTDVYLADTIGEMGLIYQLAPLVFVGGSLIPFGGQNMLEPMRFKRVVFVGPHPFNFKEIMAAALADQAIIQVKDEKELEQRMAFFLTHADSVRAVSERAQRVALSEMAVLERIYTALCEQVEVF